jgi:hypothetical protein
MTERERGKRRGRRDQLHRFRVREGPVKASKFEGRIEGLTDEICWSEDQRKPKMRPVRQRSCP